MVKIIPNIGFPYTYKDKPIIIEFNGEISVHYKINLVKNGSIKKTYEIQKVISKSGVIKKITTSLVTVFFAFNMQFGWFKPNQGRMEPQKEQVVRMVPSHIEQYQKLHPSELVVKNYPSKDKIKLTQQQRKQVNDLAFRVNTGSIRIDEALLQLRAGDGIVDLVVVFAFVIFVNWYDSFFTHGFQQVPLPHMDPMGWMNGKYDHRSVGPSTSKPTTVLQINKPTTMPHQEFVGLTKEERRSLPHSNDMKIIHEGRPELEVGFWQSKFKVGDHGAVHDLPYTVKSNGGTKTEKTDENTLKMMRSIVDMPNREKVLWFEDGTYQGGTDRGFDAIHIYDEEKQVIAVFKKSTGKFITTCQLNRDEHNELLETHNFGGGAGWFSGKVRNLPPQQTARNTFESDVMGITPSSPMDENSSPGFPPTSSFESDVMSTTPIDNSQLDNP